MIKNIFDKIKGVKIAIVGDLMLDVSHFGEQTRKSAEADLTIVDVQSKSVSLGGAGNVAQNVSSLGGKAFLIAGVGQNDPSTDAVLDLTNNARVSLRSYRAVSSIPRKNRIYNEADEMVCRFDEETIGEHTEATRNVIIQSVFELRSLVDAYIISDYDKGAIDPIVIKAVVDTGKPVIADPKVRNFWNYKGVDVLKPNQTELSISCPFQNASTAASYIFEKLQLKSLLVTRGIDGMRLFEIRGVSRIDGIKVDALDVCGCGDTATAAFTLAYAGGIGVLDSAKFANVCAAVAVTQKGCAAVSREMIEDASIPICAD